jgi:hypothetical protein
MAVPGSTADSSKARCDVPLVDFVIWPVGEMQIGAGDE